ncbi:MULTISPECIES: Gp138 family membrane-puncturing spike protein [unclassified Pseudomonas]|uniref:Gp138 family membrane-puncturing spike protein n=1 Tax=unclassified Pseudomonas TaxID=196821 RepID=UPI0022497868|nr:Gp138 family membrane-puncturing spike protein [Pseudomonas sp. DCB_BG]MCX2708352.1 Gp138 family membrane-puncturing spike protein [Pseudomonas sp. DCB_BG]
MQQQSLIDVINNQIADTAHDWDTAFPARIIRINSAERLSVDVQMMSYRTDNDGDITDDVAILQVPVIFPSTQTAALTLPINVGDLVLCVCSQTSLDNFKIQGNSNSTVVNDHRRFSTQDAIAIPGLYPFGLSKNNPQARHFTHDTKSVSLTGNLGTGLECRVVLQPDGNIVLETEQAVEMKCKTFDLTASESISLTAPQMNVNVQATNWTGQGYVIGEFTVNNIPMSTHAHTGVTPGSGSTGLPQA